MKKSHSPEPQESNAAKVSRRRNITFELSKFEHSALYDDATQRGLRSIHQRAREVVVDYLSNHKAEEVLERISALESEFLYLGDLIRRLAYSVITHAAGRDSKEANAWIRENMPRTRG
jgi:hypothetical protein